MTEFTRYCTINQIRKDTVRIASCVLKYRHIDKGTYLFHQGDTPDKFYGIIKGSISIRVLPHMKTVLLHGILFDSFTYSV